jgi:hypothetical protein
MAKHRATARTVRYLPADASWEVTVLKTEFNCVPSVMTAVMIATEMPAAISPYSMAVAADSSFANRVMSAKVFMCANLSRNAAARDENAADERVSTPD